MKNRIKEIRVNNKLNKSEFAKKIGISPSAIGYLEDGTKSPSLETLQIICKEFKIDGNWLLLGIESDFLTEEERKIIKGYKKCTDKEKGRIEEIIDSSENNRPIKKEGNLL